jgi:hypothetical protein
MFVASVAVAALPPILREAAVPVRLVPAPENVVAVAVPETPRLDNPLTVPPVIATALAFCVAIVPKVLVAAATKAVVALWVVFVPEEAVGAKGTPVNVGLALKTLLPVPVEVVTPVPPESTGNAEPRVKDAI